jgi:hypothetical protein
MAHMSQFGIRSIEFRSNDATLPLIWGVTLAANKGSITIIYYELSLHIFFRRGRINMLGSFTIELILNLE